MDTVRKTGNTLLLVIILLYTVWFMGAAFFDEPIWFHVVGAIATALFILRIARGDD
jgi:hypothetical protein